METATISGQGKLQPHARSMKTGKLNSARFSPPAAVNRRAFLTTTALAASALLARRSSASERDWSGKGAVRYPDPDIVVLDPRFAKYKIGNTPIHRLYHSDQMLWAEG